MGNMVSIKETKNLFISLDKMQSHLDQWVDSKKGVWPDIAYTTAKKWLKEGLQPRGITRDLKNGFAVPKAGYEGKVFYVWFDAPIGYIGITKEEIESDYERNTGLVIIETFKGREINPDYTPGVLCTNHGVFSWGKDPKEAVHNAVVIEEVAKMATRTELIKPDVKPAPDFLRDKHFFRKHGANAYYGQKK